MSNLRQAAEMALKALENAETDTLVEVAPHVWEYRGSLVIQALRKALNDKPAVKSYAGGKPNYCTPVDAVSGFTVTEPRQSLSRMKPGDRFVLVRTGEICRIENDGSQWNETAQRPSRFHKNSQVRLIVDAVNMTPELVDETAKSEHEPYDQTALELCEKCGWKAIIPDEGCLVCARNDQEPVMWSIFDGKYHDVFDTKYDADKIIKFKKGKVVVKPLYTTPPKKEWVGLTDREIEHELTQEFAHWWNRHVSVCRAIETKLKDKNT